MKLTDLNLRSYQGLRVPGFQGFGVSLWRSPMSAFSIAEVS